MTMRNIAKWLALFGLFVAGPWASVAEAEPITLDCSGEYEDLNKSVRKPIKGLVLIVDLEAKEVSDDRGKFTITEVSDREIRFERPYAEKDEPKPGKNWGYIKRITGEARIAWSDYMWADERSPPFDVSYKLSCKVATPIF